MKRWPRAERSRRATRRPDPSGALERAVRRLFRAGSRHWNAAAWRVARSRRARTPPVRGRDAAKRLVLGLRTTRPSRGRRAPTTLGPVMKTAIITVSTSVAAGKSEDRSGEALAQLAAAAGAEVIAREVVADDRKAIEKILRRHTRNGTALIFTTGGTGFTHDDVTPEATRAVI